MKNKKLIVITGPTASGKSALAISLAHQLSTEIISADSRQIFQGIPIVTAVPTADEREGVEHHLMEILPLEAYYSASEFETDALSICGRLFRDRDEVIVCGGSMMYIDALCNGIDDMPTVSPAVRESLMEEWNEKGDGWLLSRLEALDSEHFNKVDRRNMKRVFHAVEISLESGRPYSSFLTGNRRARPFEILKFTLEGERELLFSRINRRVEMMVEAGLEEEARRVEPMRHLNSLNTVGLKEMFAYFDGLMSFDEAIARIQKNTRVYAKKQMTWHKRDESIIKLELGSNADENAGRIIRDYIRR